MDYFVTIAFFIMCFNELALYVGLMTTDAKIGWDLSNIQFLPPVEILLEILFFDYLNIIDKEQSLNYNEQ